MQTEIIDQIDTIMAALMSLMEHLKKAAAQGGPVAEIRRDMAALEARILLLEAMHNAS